MQLVATLALLLLGASCGEIAESVTGTALSTLIAERLTEPLGITDTRLPPNDDTSLPEPAAHGYAFGCPDNLECMRVRKGADVTARSVSGALGAGGMVARFSDLGVWGASGVVCMLCGRCGSSCAALLDRARETKEVTAGTSGSGRGLVRHAHLRRGVLDCDAPGGLFTHVDGDHGHQSLSEHGRLGAVAPQRQRCLRPTLLRHPHAPRSGADDLSFAT